MLGVRIGHKHQQLLDEVAVIPRGSAARRVQHDGLGRERRLVDLVGPADIVVEDLVFPVRAQPFRPLQVARGPSAARDERAEELELRVQVCLHLPCLLEQTVDALERPTADDRRDDEVVARRERVDRAHVQARRVVDDDVVVVILHLAQAFTQSYLLRHDGVHHDRPLGFGQLEVGRYDIKIREVCMLDDLCRPHCALHDVGHTRLVVAISLEELRRVPLLVIVDEQDLLAVFGGEQVAHVDRGHGLADAAFQVCDGDDDHVVLPPVVHPPHTLRAGTDSLLR